MTATPAGCVNDPLAGVVTLSFTFPHLSWLLVLFLLCRRVVFYTPCRHAYIVTVLARIVVNPKLALSISVHNLLYSTLNKYKHQ